MYCSGSADRVRNSPHAASRQFMRTGSTLRIRRCPEVSKIGISPLLTLRAKGSLLVVRV